jgi:hypothetical protein
MTIVIAYQNEHTAMLLGDAMVSGLEEPGRACSLPVIGPVTNVFPIGSGYTIKGLTQKVTLISDECVVAWSGNKLGARMAMIQLAGLAETEVINPDLIGWFLKNLDADAQRLRNSLLGFVVGDKGPELFSNFEHRERIELGHGTAVVDGSTPEFMEDFLRSSARSRLPGNCTYTPAQIACEYGLQIATHHLASETNGFAQLLRYFGGAYEVATYENRKFSKCDGATYVFWHGYKGEPAATPAYPALVLSTSYRGADFLVMVQEFSRPPWHHDGTIRSRLSVVRPVHAPAGQLQQLLPTDFSLQPNWLCHHFVYGDAKQARRMCFIQQPIHMGADSFAIRSRYGAILAMDYKAKFWRDVFTAIEMGPPI